MKFERAYTNYVRTEGQCLTSQCPFVEFERLKDVLKRCPHTGAPIEDAEDESATVRGTDVPSPAGPLGGAVINRQSTDPTTDLGVSTERNPSSSSSKKAHISCPACDDHFFPDLDKAVSDVVGCFNKCAESLLRRHMAKGIRKYFMKLKRKLSGEKTTMVQMGNTLVSYGCMNSLAVRKILKKYDKIHSSESGRAYKLRLEGRRMELLQSPLLIELAALAVNLMKSVPTGLSQPLAAGQHSCNFDPDQQTITYSLPDGVRLDFDLTCSICLDVVFDPVALSCGHIFCRSCACTAASVSLFYGVDTAKRHKKCPICRKSGVHAGAVQMRELHMLVKERCSSYYAERLPEERKKRILASKMHWEAQTQTFLRR